MRATRGAKFVQPEPGYEHLSSYGVSRIEARGDDATVTSTPFKLSKP